MSTLIVFHDTVANPSSNSPRAAAAKLVSLFPIQTAFGFGQESAQHIDELAKLGVVTQSASAEPLSGRQRPFVDLCVCINMLNEVSVEKTDETIDLLCKSASHILFAAAVPGKGQHQTPSLQTDDYWLSMFEIRGFTAVDGFAEGEGQMPVLFCSRAAVEASEQLKAAWQRSDFSWRDRFRTGPGEVRAKGAAIPVGPDTRGQTRRIAASVVTYQPKPEQLERISHLAQLFAHVFVADNSEPSADPVGGVEWISMSGNKGIASGLNAVCKKAKEMGYEWLFTLDQDTDVEKESLDNYLAKFAEYEDKDGTAIVAPKTDGRDLRLDGEGEVRELEMVMTSGCLTNLEIWEKIGGFADELFIDEVDHDYCLNARKNGYRVVRLLDAHLPHQPGRLMTIVTLRGRPTLVGWHPPIRLYYIIRNYFFMKRRYRDVFPEVILERKRLVKAKFREYLLYHEDRLPSVLAMIKGAVHGFIGRFGK